MTYVLVSAKSTRPFETPVASTETLASPTVGGTVGTSLWRVRMAGGNAGPRHTIDSEQVWTVIAGRATVHGDAGESVITPGDTVIMPANIERSVTAIEDCEFVVCGSPLALAGIPGSDAEPASPPWVL